jgi:hypothetical protein
MQRKAEIMGMEHTNFFLLCVQVTVHHDKCRINNQLDAPNIQNLFCHKTLHVSGIFCAHHQELSAVHLAIGMFHAGYVAAAEDSQV